MMQIEIIRSVIHWEITIMFEYDYVDGEKLYEDFIRDNKHNRDIFNRIMFLTPGEIFKETHFICFDENRKIIGNIALQVSDNERIIWLKHIAVDEDYKNKGIATELLKLCFAHIQKEDKILEFSSFTEAGQKYLIDVVKRINDEYQIDIISKEIENRNNIVNF